MKQFLFALFLTSPFFLLAKQNSRLDSLLIASKTDHGKALVHNYNEISWEYKNSNADSALFYGKKALKIAESIKDDKAIASAYNSIASSYEALSQLDMALDFHQKSLDIKTQIKDTIGIANTLNNLGIIYDTKGNYTKALESYFNALRIYEDYSTEFQKVPMVYVNIGIVYKKQKAYDKVLEYYKKALEIYEENDYFVGVAITTGNVGSVLLNLERYEESINYSLKAEQLYDSLGYSRYMPYMRVNIAIAKDSLKQYGSAKKDYLSSINAFTKDNNLYELSNAKVNLAHNYISSNDFLKAKKELEEAIDITRHNDFKEIEIKALKQLSVVGAAIGDYKDAFKYLSAYTIEKDSVFETEKTRTVFELEKKYQTEKKEKEILSQRADLAEKELNISKKNTQLMILGVLAAILSLLGYLFYNQQKLKNKQLQKENELKDALIKIETQNRLQEQRLRISRDLHDNIGAQLTFIISSIDNLKYGFDIKDDKLTNKLDRISEFTSTTIYELRDTIWAMNTSEISVEDLQSRISNFIDNADAASHGVAFQFNWNEAENREYSFNSVEGMNIYRIIQESINNALKYANAKHVSVDFSAGKEGFVFKVSDDGKGFDTKHTALGNGINNMRKRAHDIDADIDIVSEENRGTTITLTTKV
ncbi:tetratricopeptide repeat-containing sensor histidine kinase [Psychroserpens sp. MEBiC05023]